MAVIGQRMVILLQLCIDKIDITLPYHSFDTKYKSFGKHAPLL